MVPIFVPSSFSIMKRAASVRIDSWEGLSKSLRRSVFDFCGVMGSYSPLKSGLLKHSVRKPMSSLSLTLRFTCLPSSNVLHHL